MPATQEGLLGAEEVPVELIDFLGLEFQLEANQVVVGATETDLVILILL